MIKAANNKEYTSQTVQVALRILEEVAREGETGVRELGRSLGITHAKVHRLLATLEECGYLGRNPANGHYRLSLKLFELGSAGLRRYGLLEESRPFLQDLAARTGETVMLGVREGGWVVYVDRIPSKHPVQLVHRVGERAPLYGTASGKVFLAWMNPEERAKALGPGPFPRLAAHTATTMQELETEMDVVRKQGYGVNNEERFDGIRSVAVPVFNHRGEPTATVIVGGPALRVGSSDLTELSSLAKAAALGISQRLGYREQVAHH